MKRLLLLLLIWSPLALHALRYEGDPASRHVEIGKAKKRVDTFDFGGAYPHLEKIEIDARKNKNVEFELSGDYPLLELVNYEGAFGFLKGKLTGHFPKLSIINILCTSCAMDLDFHADWIQNCEINITGLKEDLHISLPEGVGIQLNTRVAPKGKVYVPDGYKKKGWLGVLRKTYQNELFETAPIKLVFNVQTSEGKIIFNSQ